MNLTFKRRSPRSAVTSLAASHSNYPPGVLLDLCSAVISAAGARRRSARLESSQVTEMGCGSLLSLHHHFFFGACLCTRVYILISASSIAPPIILRCEKPNSAAMHRGRKHDTATCARLTGVAQPSNQEMHQQNNKSLHISHINCATRPLKRSRSSIRFFLSPYEHCILNIIKTGKKIHTWVKVLLSAVETEFYLHKSFTAATLNSVPQSCGCNSPPCCPVYCFTTVRPPHTRSPSVHQMPPNTGCCLLKHKAAE